MIKRVLCTALVLVYFLTNSAFAYVRETGFWEERSRLSQPVKQSADLPGLTPTHRSSKTLTLTQFGTLKSPDVLAAGGILHIQDVHENFEAQTNIGGAIEHLIKTNQVDLIALEGAMDPIDVQAFRDFPNQRIVKTVSDRLLQQNKLSGPIHAAMTHQTRAVVIGIDDKTHYDRNVEAAKNALKDAPRLKKMWANDLRDMNAKKEAAFNPALKQFDALAQKQARGELPFGTYVEELAKRSRPGPATRLYLEALSLESTLDFKRVETERVELIHQLTEKISDPDKNTLLALSGAFQEGRINHADFYETLKTLCANNGVTLNRYPAMAAYVRYVLLSERVESDTLLSETRELEKAVYAALATTPGETRLIAESRQMDLRGKLLDLGLTKDEWNEYRTSHAHTNIACEAFETFYTEADTRDRLMAENLANAIKTYNAKNTVLVTGGFHSRGMDAYLRERAHTSIATFVPKLTHIDGENGTAYLSVFSQQKTPLEKLFDGEKLFLAKPPLAPAVRMQATAWMSVLAAQAKIAMDVIDRFVQHAMTGWSMQKLALDAAGPATLTLRSPRNNIVLMSVDPNSGDTAPKKKRNGLVPDMDEWVAHYERIKNTPLPYADIRDAMSEYERRGVTHIIYPAARYDTLLISGLLDAFPDVQQVTLIDPVYEDRDFAEYTRRDFQKTHPDVTLNFVADNYLTMEKWTQPGHGRILLVDKWPGNNAELRENLGYRKAIMRDVRPLDYVLTHPYPMDNAHMLTFARQRIAETSVPNPLIDKNKFTLWQIAPDDYTDEVLVDSYNTIRTNPKESLRRKALSDLPSGLMGDEFTKTLLYVFSDPNWKIRQEATSAYMFSAAPHRTEKLIEHIRNPEVALVNDPRMNNTLYDAARARRNARLAGFWALQKMLTAREADADVVRNELTGVNEKELAARLHHIMASDPTNPLGTPEKLSLLEAIVICGLWYGRVVYSTAKLESEREWDDADVAEAQHEMEALSNLTETVATIIEELYPYGDLRFPHILRDVTIMIFTGHIIETSDTHKILKTWPSGAEAYLDMVVPGKPAYPSSIVYSLLKRFTPNVADSWASAISMASLALEIPGIILVLTHFDFMTSGLLLTLFGLAHGTRGSPWSHVRVFGLYLLTQPILAAHPYAIFVPALYHMFTDFDSLKDGLAAAWERLINPNGLQWAGAGIGSNFLFSKRPHRIKREGPHYRKPRLENKMRGRALSDKDAKPKPAPQELVDAFDGAVRSSTLREKLKKQLLALPLPVKAEAVLASNHAVSIPGVSLTLNELSRIDYLMITGRNRYIQKQNELKEQKAAEKKAADLAEKRRLHKQALDQIKEKKYEEAASSLLRATTLSEELMQLTFNVWKDIGNLYFEQNYFNATYALNALQTLERAASQITLWRPALHPLMKTYEDLFLVIRAELLIHSNRKFQAMRVLSNDEYDIKINEQLEGNAQAQELWERLHDSAEAYVLFPVSFDEDYLADTLKITGTNFTSLHTYGLLIQQRIANREDPEPYITEAAALADAIDEKRKMYGPLPAYYAGAGTYAEHVRKDIVGGASMVLVRKAIDEKRYADALTLLENPDDRSITGQFKLYYPDYYLYRSQAIYMLNKNKDDNHREMDEALGSAQQALKSSPLTDKQAVEMRLWLAKIAHALHKPYIAIEALRNGKYHIHPLLERNEEAYLIAIHANADLQQTRNIAIIASAGLAKFPQNHELRQWAAATRVQGGSNPGFYRRGFLPMLLAVLTLIPGLNALAQAPVKPFSDIQIDSTNSSLHYLNERNGYGTLGPDINQYFDDLYGSIYGSNPRLGLGAIGVKPFRSPLPTQRSVQTPLPTVEQLFSEPAPRRAAPRLAVPLSLPVLPQNNGNPPAGLAVPAPAAQALAPLAPSLGRAAGENVLRAEDNAFANALLMDNRLSPFAEPGRSLTVLLGNESLARIIPDQTLRAKFVSGAFNAKMVTLDARTKRIKFIYATERVDARQTPTNVDLETNIRTGESFATSVVRINPKNGNIIRDQFVETGFEALMPIVVAKIPFDPAEPRWPTDYLKVLRFERANGRLYAWVNEWDTGKSIVVDRRVWTNGDLNQADIPVTSWEPHFDRIAGSATETFYSQNGQAITRTYLKRAVSDDPNFVRLAERAIQNIWPRNILDFNRALEILRTIDTSTERGRRGYQTAKLAWRANDAWLASQLAPNDLNLALHRLFMAELESISPDAAHLNGKIPGGMNALPAGTVPQNALALSYPNPFNLRNDIFNTLAPRQEIDPAAATMARSSLGSRRPTAGNTAFNMYMREYNKQQPDVDRVNQDILGLTLVEGRKPWNNTLARAQNPLYNLPKNDRYLKVLDYARTALQGENVPDIRQFHTDVLRLMGVRADSATAQTLLSVLDEMAQPVPNKRRLVNLLLPLRENLNLAGTTLLPVEQRNDIVRSERKFRLYSQRLLTNGNIDTLNLLSQRGLANSNDPTLLQVSAAMRLSVLDANPRRPSPLMKAYAQLTQQLTEIAQATDRLLQVPVAPRNANENINRPVQDANYTRIRAKYEARVKELESQIDRLTAAQAPSSEIQELVKQWQDFTGRSNYIDPTEKKESGSISNNVFDARREAAASIAALPNSLLYILTGNKKWGTVGMLGEMVVISSLLFTSPALISVPLITAYAIIHVIAGQTSTHVSRPPLFTSLLVHGFIFGWYVAALPMLTDSPTVIALPIALHLLSDITLMLQPKIKRGRWFHAEPGSTAMVMDGLIRRLKRAVLNDADFEPRPYEVIPFDLDSAFPGQATKTRALYENAKKNLDDVLKIVERQYSPELANEIRTKLSVVGVFTRTRLLINELLSPHYRWGMMRNSRGRFTVFVPISTFGRLTSPADQKWLAFCFVFGLAWAKNYSELMKNEKLNEEQIHQAILKFETEWREKEKEFIGPRFFIRHLWFYLLDRLTLMRLRYEIRRDFEKIKKDAAPLQHEIETILSSDEYVNPRTGVLDRQKTEAKFWSRRDQAISLHNRLEASAVEAMAFGDYKMAYEMVMWGNYIHVLDTGLLPISRDLMMLRIFVRTRGYQSLRDALINLREKEVRLDIPVGDKRRTVVIELDEGEIATFVTKAEKEDLFRWIMATLSRQAQVVSDPEERREILLARRDTLRILSEIFSSEEARSVNALMNSATNDNSNILRMSPTPSIRLVQIANIEPAKASDRQIADLLYALSDPHVFNRQSAAGKLGLLPADKSGTWLLKFIERPMVPGGWHDMRLGEKPYDAARSRENARMGALWALYLSLENNAALGELSGKIRTALERDLMAWNEASETTFVEMLQQNKEHPLGSQREISLLEAMLSSGRVKDPKYVNEAVESILLRLYRTRDGVPPLLRHLVQEPEKAGSSLLLVDNEIYKWTTAWWFESSILAAIIFAIPGGNPFVTGLIINALFVQFHFGFDRMTNQQVERDRFLMHVGAFMINLTAFVVLIHLGFPADPSGAVYKYAVTHSVLHFLWNFIAGPAALSVAGGTASIGDIAARNAASQPTKLNLRHAMMKPMPNGEREINVIEISDKTQVETLMSNAEIWQRAQTERRRDVIFVINPELLSMAKRTAGALNFAKGQTTFLSPFREMTLPGILEQAHNMGGLSSRASASVALYATSERWADLKTRDMDLSRLSISVVGLIRYMVNVMDSSVTPIETQLKAETAAKRAA